MSTGNYRPGDGLQSWATTLPATVHAGPRISGYGSPEGTVEGQPGKEYVDIDTDFLWRKRKGMGSIGWEKIGSVSDTESSGTSGSTGIPFKTTAERDAWVPDADYAACLLTDSDPPYQLSIWADGAWN